MGNPFARLSTGGKRGVIGLVMVLLVMAGSAVVLTSQLLHGVLPEIGGVALASSPLAPPDNPSPDAQAVIARLDILLVRLDEAWKLCDWRACVETATEILSLDPSNVPMRERLYQAHVNLGWRALVDHCFDDASSQFTLARRIEPDGDEAGEGLRLLQELVVPAGGIVPPPTTVPPVVVPPVAERPTVPPAAVAPPVVCPPVPTPAVVCPPQPVVVPVCPPKEPVLTGELICHVVRTGDTLFSLARRFGTTVEAIIAVNKLPTCTIFICQKLLIPVGKFPAPCPPVVCPTVVSPPVVCPTVVPPPVVCPPVVCPPAFVPICPAPIVIAHVVQRGEDLFHLAIRYKVSVAMLMQVNGLTATTVKAGQVLIVP